RFKQEFGLYSIREIDGRDLGVSLTLNHQLIFAAMGMRLLVKGCDDLSDQLKGFYGLLPDNMLLRRDGLIHHHVRRGRSQFGRNLFDIALFWYRRKIADRSQGYQSFNLFAMATARRNYPGSAVWKNEQLNAIFPKVLEYALHPAYLRSIVDNPFSLAYRLTGPEILWFKKTFSLSGEELGLHQLIKVQFERHWDPKTGLLCRNTDDPETLSSRIYEMCYLVEQ
ncbi:MAG: hypothetical protein JRF69_12345, partial [Deltaproteobacteria bacterium]|nr:hypothetical protein [Deltaproteobacteria bacterium]